VAALAIAEEAVKAEAAWSAVTLDDRWQLEKWGSDAEAEGALENRRTDFMAAIRFLRLLD
jgi:chaperone required for assembly of F1-ATPase